MKTEIKHKICNYGFCLSKTKLSYEQIKKIKDDLTVSPESSFGNYSPTSFRVYKDTPNYYIVPIYYGLQNLEITDYVVSFPGCSSGTPIQNIISLRDNQTDCFKNCINEFEKPFGGGIITLNTGMGKCLAKDTKVIMYNGTTKKVQDLIQGDLLMGDDNTPRKILTLTKGFNKMYTIVPVKGPRFTVNKAHILVLKNSVKEPIITKRTRFNRIRYNVIWWENNELCNKLFKTEEEALKFKNEVAKPLHQLYSEISVNDWLKTSKAFRNVFKAYRVPIDFPQVKSNNIINASKEEKLQYITEVIDSRDTKLDKETDTLYFYKKNNDIFVEEFLFICRSVGLYTHEYNTKHGTKITIQGNIHLPLKNKDLINENKDPNKDWSMTNISIKYKERGEYYGFTLDGNRRFLFEDFTVTHNTVVSLKLIAHSQKKTLVIVNKVELLNQWKKEIQKWIPDAKIGIIQGSKFEYEDCHIVLGMLQTIAIKKDIKVIDFTWVENCIIDECHNISSEVFSNIMFKVRPRYVFGLTATLERKDKLEKVIKWYIGETLYDGSNKNLKQTTQIYVLKYFGSSSVEKYLRDGTAAVATMLSNISTDITRSNYIVNVLKKLIEDHKDRSILVISDRIAQLRYINSKLPEDSGLFIGSMKSADLDLTKTKRIVLGTYPLVNEGFNLPKLNCLVFATPRSSITQAIGRIYRKTHTGITPVIIDIMDDFSIFKGQHYRRRKIYKTSIENCSFITQSLDSFALQSVQSKVFKLELDTDSESSDNESPSDLANKILSKKCLLEDF